MALWRGRQRKGRERGQRKKVWLRAELFALLSRRRRKRKREREEAKLVAVRHKKEEEDDGDSFLRHQT